MTFQKKLLTACVLSIACVQTLPVQAGTQYKSYEVHYTATELSTPDGSAHVYARIQKTANTVCVDEFGMKRFLQRLEMQRCVKEITKDLVAKVGHGNLDTIYAANKSKERAPHRTKATRHASR